MNAIERMRNTLKGMETDRIPFVPSIYEHGAVLIGVTPSQAARNAKLMADAQVEAYARYQHDYVVVGMDIYDIEAEALGCAVRYPENNETPFISSNILADHPERLLALTIPDPEISGRMPLMLEAAVRVREQIGHSVDIGIAMVGPFTLATLLRGYENLMMDLIDEPDYAAELFAFTGAVELAFGKAAARAGFQVAINESWIAQPLMSPDMYRETVFPLHQALVRGIKAEGAYNVSVVSGGDTTRIAESLYETGSSIIMADGGLDMTLFMTACRKHRAALRACVSPQLVEQGSIAEIESSARAILARFPDRRNLILGCGIVSTITHPDRIRLLSRIVQESVS